MTLPRVFRVALDMPLRRLFDYLAPEAGSPEAHHRRDPTCASSETASHPPPEPGMRVRVPFGRQQLVGVIMATSESSDVAEDRLKPLLEVLDPTPVLDRAALGLLEWAAEYYHHPIGEVLATALPKGLRLGASAKAHDERWGLTAEGHEARLAGEPRRAPKQRQLLALLAEHGSLSADSLAEHFPNWRDSARALVARMGRID
jgi:primosomal protein N' (replication factor Y) (superfamily II helicase)